MCRSLHALHESVARTDNSTRDAASTEISLTQSEHVDDSRPTAPIDDTMRAETGGSAAPCDMSLVRFRIRTQDDRASSFTDLFLFSSMRAFVLLPSSERGL
jgi:hypothetical protein